MTMKSLLLGSATGLALAGVAQAADLPMAKGEAVQYVKVCSAFGPGFFYIPGTDTCLKIGGEVRADYRVFGGDRLGFVPGGGNPMVAEFKWNRNNNRSAFNTEARIWFDARTQTDYGPLRSYFQIDAGSHPLGAGGRSNTYNGNTFTIDKAFIQFGGLTAGYAHSFFGFYDIEYGDTIFAPYYAESNTVNLLAYTAQFGSGFNATLSIEDGRDHRSIIVVNPSPGSEVTRVLNFSKYGGQEVPDIVGQLRYDTGWGSLATQAAGHQVRSGGSGAPSYDKYGFAIGGTVLIKIPVANGGHFIVEGQYADGAVDYLGANNSVLGSQDAFRRSAGFGNYESGKGWSIVAELGGNITPVLNANLVGSYIDTSLDGAMFNPRGSNDLKIKEYTIAGNLTYTIGRGLTIGGEVSRTQVTVDNVLVITATGGTARRNVQTGIWQAGVRLRRTF